MKCRDCLVHTHTGSVHDDAVMYISYLFCKRDLYSHLHSVMYIYEVVMISRLLKIIGPSCKRALKKRRYSAKETYNFKEPNNRSHPIDTHFSLTVKQIYSRMHRTSDTHVYTHSSDTEIHTRFTVPEHRHLQSWSRCRRRAQNW